MSDTPGKRKEIFKVGSATALALALVTSAASAQEDPKGNPIDVFTNESGETVWVYEEPSGDKVAVGEDGRWHTYGRDFTRDEIRDRQGYDS